MPRTRARNHGHAPTSKERIAALRATIHSLQHKLDMRATISRERAITKLKRKQRVDALVRELGAAEDALKAMEQ